MNIQTIIVLVGGLVVTFVAGLGAGMIFGDWLESNYGYMEEL